MTRSEQRARYSEDRQTRSVRLIVIARWPGFPASKRARVSRYGAETIGRHEWNERQAGLFQTHKHCSSCSHKCESGGERVQPQVQVQVQVQLELAAVGSSWQPSEA